MFSSEKSFICYVVIICFFKKSALAVVPFNDPDYHQYQREQQQKPELLIKPEFESDSELSVSLKSPQTAQLNRNYEVVDQRPPTTTVNNNQRIENRNNLTIPAGQSDFDDTLQKTNYETDAVAVDAKFAKTEVGVDKTSSSSSNLLHEKNQTFGLVKNTTTAIWQIHVHLTCPGICNGKYLKINQWTKELIQSKEFAMSRYRFRTQKLSATHCECPVQNGVAVELYLNQTNLNSRKNQKQCFCYDGDPNHRVEFWNFLRRHNNLPLEFLKSSEFEKTLDEANNDEDHTTVIIFYERRCESSKFYKLLQHLSHALNATIYKIQYPLKLELEIEVLNRLTSPPAQCQMLVLNGGHYLWLSTDTAPITVMQLINQTKDENTVQWKKIKEGLTDVEKAFYIGKAMSQKHIWKPTCILVGTSGGIAVIALAISIFWGLNGSSFTAR